MSGAKTVVNKTGFSIICVLRARNGQNPAAGELTGTSAPVPVNGSHMFVYGTDQDPYLNTLVVSGTTHGAHVSHTFTCAARGGPGTLDYLFNNHSTLEIDFAPASHSFSIVGH